MMRARLWAAAGAVAALGLGGGVAVATTSSSTEVISGCVNPSGLLRVIDPATETCRSNETTLSWNQTGPQGETGPQGQTGPQGPQGDVGPAGPAHVATGYIAADGTILASHGPVPTVTSLGDGRYGFELVGLGGGCVLPQLTSVARLQTMTFEGGSCGGGGVTTTVVLGSGIDGQWTYLIVGADASSLAKASADGQTLPALP